LDLLVERSQSHQFKNILCQFGCKLVVSPQARRYPAIEDYLGYDQPSGRFFHLQVHYQLILGEHFTKNYWLPLEQQFLKSCLLQDGVRIPPPELEVIVLAVRALLKYRIRDAVKDLLSIPSRGLSLSLIREFEYLLRQTSLERIAEKLKSEIKIIPPAIVFEFLETVVHSPRSGRKLLKLKSRLRHDLVAYQRHSHWYATYRYLFALIFSRSLLLRSYFGKKKITTGGMLIALIGADGSGKSTIVHELRRWLSWKLDVHTCYMGTSQRLSLPSRIAKSTSQIVAWLGDKCSAISGEKNSVSRVLERIHLWTRYLVHLSIAVMRYNRHRASRRKAAQGSIVISDRYPLEGFSRVTDNSRHPQDGPRISWMCRDAKAKGPVAYLARKENQLYGKIQPPDYVIVLHVCSETSLQRKPEIDQQIIQAKIQAIEKLERDGLRVIDIDANQPLEEVLPQIKSALWRIL
jgi:thymidylate kinase